MRRVMTTRWRLRTSRLRHRSSTEHLGERLQEVADQAKELADLGLHFKKTGIMHVRPTQAVTKETAEDRERIDC
eukprot:COSAG06_NODE_15831_length_1041_cov_7.052017_2_plen_73_part_01